jgi:hypothetical protein
VAARVSNFGPNTTPQTASVHADRNQGDWTAIHSFDLPPVVAPTVTPKKFRLGSSGYLVRGRARTVYIYVKDLSSLANVSGASVRVSGAGLLTTKTTGTNGAVKFYLKPTRLGTVTFRVTKGGYTTAYLYKKVRTG